MLITKIINFTLKHIVLIITFKVLAILSSEVLRPRGVSLSRASLYIPDKDFVCLDGSKTIPFSYLNDDYCDCADGSDEPGTSACQNGQFYCRNAGHKPINIPTSRVNDGICDCCDASDEYTSSINCINNCNELGQAAQLERQRIAEITKVGYLLKLEYSQKGVRLKQEKKHQLIKLQKHKIEAEVVLKEKETLKQQAEEKESAALEKYKYIEEQERLEKDKEEAAKTRTEATEVFSRFDSNQDGIIEVSELQVRETFDKDRNGEVSFEEAKFFLNDQDFLDIERFISEAWPIIKPFMLRDAGLFQPPSTENGEPEDGTEEENLPVEDDIEAEAGEEVGEYVNEDDEENPGTDQPEDEDHVNSADLSKYDEETQKLIDVANNARKDYDAANQDVKDIQTELTNLESYLENDYGPLEEFAVLQGQCFEYYDHEYIYKLCPFDKTIQQQKSSSSETRLGTWSKWEGSDINKFETMVFENGQQCWNGPQRSTKVRVGCGSENKLISVAEPNRCEYEFDFITPAICKELKVNLDTDFHDEL